MWVSRSVDLHIICSEERGPLGFSVSPSWARPDGVTRYQMTAVPRPNSREGPRLVGVRVEGHSIGEIAKRFEVGERTLDRWRHQFGRMKGEEVRCPRGCDRVTVRLER